jgi:hydrogenase maturation protease
MLASAAAELAPGAGASGARAPEGPHTLIVGLGSPILGDDAVGLHVARELADHLPPGAADVVEAGAAGIRLLNVLSGYDRVVFVDALLAREGVAAPGELCRLRLDELDRTLRLSGSHDADLGTALALAEQLGEPLPSEVLVYGIAVREVWEFREELSPQVEAALPGIVDAIAQDLDVSQ